MTSEQGSILKILQEELAKARARNPRYSIRAFSSKLPITKRTGEKILHGLAADPKTKATLLQGLKYRENNRPTLPVIKAGVYSQIDMDQFHLICEWYYFGILSLATTDNFQDDPAWISKTLGIQKREAKSALQRMERIGFLARNKDGRLVPTGKQFKTSNGTPNAYLRKHHFEGLDLARRSMEEDAFESCDFSSITMGIDPQKLPEAKKLITHFRKSLCAFLESDPKKEVYRMSIQLFPLSNRGNFSKTKINKGEKK
jgi:hypothetical protein